MRPLRPLAALLLAPLALAACSQGEAPPPVKTATPVTSAPSSASSSEVQPETSQEARVAYGKAYTLSDGLQVVLEKPRAAQGGRKGQVEVSYTFTNRGKKALPLKGATLISLETPAGAVSGLEDGEELKQAALLPVGKTVRGKVVFDDALVRLEEVSRAFVEHGGETLAVGPSPVAP